MIRISPIVLLTTAVLALASCDKPTGRTSFYEGSSFVRVHLLTFTPAHTTNTGKSVTHHDAVVGAIRKGAGPFQIALPGRCDTIPVKMRIGREIMMREDRIRTSDGKVRSMISHDEAIAALCDESGKRDPLRGSGKT